MKESKTRVVLSFDDGRNDNYRVAMNELLPRKLKATFNITTGYVTEDINIDNMPCENLPMSVDNVKELGRHKEFEIAGHGHEHSNTLKDWTKSIEKLADWLGDGWIRDNGIGFASPHSQMSADIIRARRIELEKLNIRYVRIGLLNQRELVQRIISRAARKTESKKLFYLPVQSSLQILGEDIVVYSIPIAHAHTVEQVKYIL